MTITPTHVEAQATIPRDLDADDYSRFRGDGEALAHAGVLAGDQLAAGSLDVPALRAVLPPSVTDDQLRGTILATVAGTVEQLKSTNRGIASRQRKGARRNGNASGKTVRANTAPKSQVPSWWSPS